MIRRAHKGDVKKRRLFRQYFSALTDLVELQCIDVGSRAGFTEDIAPIAEACSVFGFEPDPGECERLSATDTRGSPPWRSITHLPVALSNKAGTETLHLYSNPGCSSLLPANQELARGFQRAHYFELQETCSVAALPLDEVVTRYETGPIHFMKIDIQGAELLAFEGAKTTLQNCLGIRTEVSFRPIYEGQPLLPDIMGFLDQYGFAPTSFLEVHSWRRESRERSRRVATGPFPVSRGELAHADLLFLRAPDTIPDSAERRSQLLRLCLIALCYDHLDFAARIFRMPEISSWIDGELQVPAIESLSKYSKALAKAKEPFSPGDSRTSLRHHAER